MSSPSEIKSGREADSQRPLAALRPAEHLIRKYAENFHFFGRGASTGADLQLRISELKGNPSVQSNFRKLSSLLISHWSTVPDRQRLFLAQFPSSADTLAHRNCPGGRILFTKPIFHHERNHNGQCAGGREWKQFPKGTRYIEACMKREVSIPHYCSIRSSARLATAGCALSSLACRK